jgi:hypothetical protein
MLRLVARRFSRWRRGAVSQKANPSKGGDAKPSAFGDLQGGRAAGNGGPAACAWQGILVESSEGEGGMVRRVLRVVLLAVVLVGVFAGVAQPAAASREPAVVTVKPYYDNGNGVWDKGEPLVKGLVVTVQTAVDGSHPQERLVGQRGAVFKMAAGVTQNIWIAQNIAFGRDLAAGGDYDYALFVPAYDIPLNPWESLQQFPAGRSTVAMPVYIKLVSGYDSTFYHGPLPHFRYVRALAP